MYLNRMLAAAANMRTLIESSLDFSRLTSREGQFQQADLNSLFNEAVNELELQIDESKTTIQTNTLPELDVIPSQIKQLFSNIISNAIKFRRPGVPTVIQVTSRLFNNQEKEEYRLPGNVYYDITLQDNGIGFEQ